MSWLLYVSILSLKYVGVAYKVSSVSDIDYF